MEKMITKQVIKDARVSFKGNAEGHCVDVQGVGSNFSWKV